MLFLIAVGLLSIAAILFYRLVERRHKIVVGKVALGLGVLAVLAILADANKERQQAAAFYQAQAEREQRAKAVKIDYMGESLRTTKTLSLYCQLLPETQRSGCKETVDTLRMLTFQFCNTGRDTVYSVLFTPLTVLKGRSTEYAVVPAEASADKAFVGLLAASTAPGNIRSDRILPPAACTLSRWEGGFSVKDSVFVRLDEVTGPFAASPVRLR